MAVVAPSASAPRNNPIAAEILAIASSAFPSWDSAQPSNTLMIVTQYGRAFSLANGKPTSAATKVAFGSPSRLSSHGTIAKAWAVEFECRNCSARRPAPFIDLSARSGYPRFQRQNELKTEATTHGSSAYSILSEASLDRS